MSLTWPHHLPTKYISLREFSLIVQAFVHHFRSLSWHVVFPTKEGLLRLNRVILRCSCYSSLLANAVRSPAHFIDCQLGRMGVDQVKNKESECRDGKEGRKFGNWQTLYYIAPQKWRRHFSTISELQKINMISSVASACEAIVTKLKCGKDAGNIGIHQKWWRPHVYWITDLSITDLIHTVVKDTTTHPPLNYYLLNYALVASLTHYINQMIPTKSLPHSIQPSAHSPSFSASISLTPTHLLALELAYPVFAALLPAQIFTQSHQNSLIHLLSLRLYISLLYTRTIYPTLNLLPLSYTDYIHAHTPTP